MPVSIAITTSSFAKNNTAPLDLIRQRDIAFKQNTLGRTLKGDEIIDLLSGCVGVIAGTEKYDATVLERLPALKIISRCGVGMDSVDLTAAKRRGVKVFNTPDAPTKAVAELVIGFILSLLRRIPDGDRKLRKNVWSKDMGSLFHQKTLGIIGFGRIGRAVAQLSNAFEATVLFCDPHVGQPSDLRAQRVDLEELLRRSDIVSLHLPFSEETKGCFAAREFRMMKKGAYLINCSRGGIINEEDLLAALKDKILQGAALDVFDKEPYNGPLIDLDNVILTPHIGSYALESRVQMELEASQNLLLGLNELKNIN